MQLYPILNQGEESSTPRRPEDSWFAVNENAPTEKLIAWTMEGFARQRIIMTTSFGMEGCALIDMYAKIGKPLTCIYLDTMFFFAETYELRDEMIERYPR